MCVSIAHRDQLLLGFASLLISLACCSNAVEDDPLPIAEQIQAMEYRSEVRMSQWWLQDSADLREEAKEILNKIYTLSISDGQRLPLTSAALTTLPETIRVWRRSKGGSNSCSGQVDVIPLEDYVKGVLPHEWITSWEMESFKAGAVAIRTYAVSWILKGGKYECADLCDTTASQVYKDSTNPTTNEAVDATRGKVLLKNGAVVFAEYSAENGDPTKTGVDDPVCAGKAVNGHGRGMCQWGSQRWAQQGKDGQWIALHYYPGATIEEAANPGLSNPDGGSISPLPFNRQDGGTLDIPAAISPITPNTNGNALQGGCAIAPAASDPPFPILLLLFFVGISPLIRKRRKISCKRCRVS